MTHIPRRGRGVDLEGKEVPVFIGPQGGKEKEESRGFPDLNGRWWRTPLIPAFGRQRQVDF